MQISTKHEFAFLCMPKCASTSIEAAIKPICNINFSGYPPIKHITAREFSRYILRFHEKKLPSIKIESFCLVREPLDWIESWYRYRMRNSLKDPGHQKHKNYTGNISYNEFIEAYISKGKRPPYASISTQYEFLKLANGKIGIDHIFPMDNLVKVGEFLTEKIGRNIEIPQKNVSPKIEIELDANLKKQLNQYLREDIALYNFVKSHGQFNKTLHWNKFSATLQNH